MGLLLILLCAAILIGVSVAIVVLVAVAGRRQSDWDMSANPNLFPCPACQKLISIEAASCPHCGHPVKAA